MTPKKRKTTSKTSAAKSAVETQAEDFEHGSKSAPLADVEPLLLGLAHALKSMFAEFAYRAKHQTGLAAIQTIMGLALKAQSRCRTTLQTF